jgi:hypothetical protein
MVTLTITQLKADCEQWHNAIRDNCDELISFKQVLLKITSRATGMPELIDIAHFENHFHILLINIHDLEQKIKLHEQNLTFPSKAEDGREPYSLLTEQRKLSQEFEGLEKMIDELKIRFSLFITQTFC